MNKVVVDVKNLVKSYDDRPVVKGVSFSIKRGEIFGILGPNGAGKTTTLEMLEALRSIDSGSASLLGYDVTTNPNKVKALIGVQPQSPAFEEKTTLTEILRFFGSIYGEKVQHKKLLKEVGLEDKAKSYPETLSGGQKQRFSIAVALVHNPKIFFLDEPTTGLDPQARRSIWEMIAKVREKGVTVVMTTHYMEEAEVLCDRVAIMDEGEIIALDTPKNLIDALLSRGFKKKRVVKQASLEDVFIDLTGKELRE